MSLKDFSKEELKIKPMVEIARLILQDAKKALTFQEIYDQIAELKGLTKKSKEEKISQFYTELNVDGRFITLGSNVWGLKVWYPVEQADEEITAPPKKKSKAKKKVKDEDEEDDFELEEDDEVVELGAEDLEEDDDDDDEEEDTGFVALEEELDVEDEDLEEEISDEGDEINEEDEEKI